MRVASGFFGFGAGSAGRSLTVPSQATEKYAFFVVSLRGETTWRACQPATSLVKVAFSATVTVLVPLPLTVRVLTALVEPSPRSQR